MVTKRPSLGYQGLIALIGVLMVALVLESMSQFWRMGTPGSQLFLIGGLTVGYGWVWWRSRLAGLAVTLLLLVAAVGGYYYLPTWTATLLNLQFETIELIDNLRAFDFESTFGRTVGLAMLSLIGLGSALLVIWEGLSRGSAFWSIVAGVLLFGTQWSWFFDRSASFFMGYMLLGLILWTIAQAAQRDAAWLASGRRVGYRSHIATPLVVVFGASLMGSIMPYEFAPIHLGEMGQKVQEAFPVLKQLRGGGAGAIGGRFSLAATGFSPNMGLLGGPVQLDNSVALYLSPDRSLTQTLYLRGATFLNYTGRTWEAGPAQKIQVGTDGSLPTGFAADVPRSYQTYQITPALNFGYTLFNVLEPLRVDELKSGYQADGDYNLLADRTVPRNTPYKVAARLPLYSAAQIRNLSAPAGPGEFASYLQRPANLPERIGTLAQSLTVRAAHPYDKALELENFFRRMPYDLNVPAAPAGRDFVDFFLFDLQRGYCTYYATAMVVMLRELGIPARLVEGFAVAPGTDWTEDGRGVRTYSVLNSQAHAWVEAYFPGYGWATFDPTPRADLPVIDRSLAAPTGSDLTPANPSDETPDDSPALAEPPDDGLGGANLGGVVDTVAREWPWFITPLLLLAALFWVGYRHLAAQDRLQASEERTLVQEVWEKAGALLSRFDLGRPAYQTPREYAATLGESFPGLKEPAAQVAEDYSQARYGPGSGLLGAEAGERARTFWGRAHEELFGKYGWRTYLWRRLRFIRKR